MQTDIEEHTFEKVKQKKDASKKGSAGRKESDFPFEK